MKILLSSYAFHPSVGGLEAMSLMLAEEFVRRGHQVKIITQTPAAGQTCSPCAVVRQPGVRQLMALVKWCDVVFHNHISLRAAWPLLLVRRPWVIVHQGWIPSGLAGSLKNLCLPLARNVAISQAIAEHVGCGSAVIPNSYDDRLFRELPGHARNRELIFVGRLIGDKGVACALRALAELKSRGITPRLTVVGGGPEEPRLRQLAGEIGLAGQVCFAGIRRGEDLVRELNAHAILIVPSLWREPFGIVALEGIACGCVVIGSAGGGLKDAIGPCGVTFPNGDHQALADCIAGLLGHPAKLCALRSAAPAHLRQFTKAAVADAYLRILHGAAGSAKELG